MSGNRTRRRRPHRRLLALAVASAVLPATFLSGGVAASGSVEARDYNLGLIRIADGDTGSLPVKLWGAIGMPKGPGPYPLVVVAHGRHGDGCRRWPCWKDERRYDLGLRHVVAALARQGMAAVAPDLNGAFATSSLSSSADLHTERWTQIVDATLARLRTAAGGGSANFGLSLAGRLDLSRLGILGHSLSGADAVSYGASHPTSALLLLAPVFDGASLPEVPVAIVGSACDNDVPGQGRRYIELVRQGPRSEPVFYVRLDGANHTFYNSRLPQRGGLGRGGAKNGCGPAQRLTPRRQRGWIARFSASFFAAELAGAVPPDWLRSDLPFPTRIYGLPVGYDRIVPGA